MMNDFLERMFGNILRAPDGAQAGTGEAEAGQDGGTALTRAAQQMNGAGAGGEGEDGKGAGEEGQLGQNGAGVGDGGEAEAYWPENLPDTLADLKGENDRETIDKLTAKLQEQQTAAPESSDKYELALPEAFTNKFGDLSDDEVLPIWREIAHKQGLSNEQFNGAIAELYEQMSEKGILDDPIDIDAEFAKLAPKTADPVQAKAQGAQRIRAVGDQVSGLVKRGVLNQTEGNIVTSLAATAEGVIALEKIMKLGANEGPKGGGEGAKDTGDPQEKALRALYPTMNRVM
jgi:ABC-type transporter Mla MlaB component